MSASGLPGNRVEANRAGMTATICRDRAWSTAEPVEAGCTTNNSTTRKSPCYDRGRLLMNVKRVAAICAVGGALAVWLAAASTMLTQPVVNTSERKTTAVELRGAALAAE